MKDKMTEYGALLMSYMGVFTLGAYVCDQFKCGHPVEPRRWILTSIFVIFFFIISRSERKNNY